MPGKVDKVIVTNFGALHGKYGAADANVHAALTRWVQADLQRGLVTEVVAVDDAASMQAAGGPAVTNALDCAQNKQAIDHIYRTFAPDYIVILGSIDVIPHQDMLNPLYTGPGGDDPDEHAFGDLPYACDTPYGQDISAFKGPTRVVSRLPDRTGAQDPHWLLDLIDAVIRHQPRPRADFQDYHAVSAEVWKDSTQLSARNMFGSDSDLQLVPPAGRPWPGARLARLVHFYNCHGASVDPQFYGQRGTQYPPALNSQDLAGKRDRGDGSHGGVLLRCRTLRDERGPAGRANVQQLPRGGRNRHVGQHHDCLWSGVRQRPGGFNHAVFHHGGPRWRIDRTRGS